MVKISIMVKGINLIAELSASVTAEKILKSLPLEASVHVWGEEIYFDIPLECDLEPDACEIVEIGSLAYWPSDPAFCIFFGPTPVSTDNRPRAFSPVNVFGRIMGDAAELKSVSNGDKITVTLVE